MLNIKVLNTSNLFTVFLGILDKSFMVPLLVFFSLYLSDQSFLRACLLGYWSVGRSVPGFLDH